ncbi:MAG: pyroglutamyl-peptidase I, partial [Lachnospiraceae bacterium]|nr:pyroglutamyl-peptidase I [Lachnospiraceae bacterium]
MKILRGERSMKILLTAFEPFNGRDINPSQMILESIKAPENIDLIKRVLPVEFDA